MCVCSMCERVMLARTVTHKYVLQLYLMHEKTGNNCLIGQIHMTANW